MKEVLWHIQLSFVIALMCIGIAMMADMIYTMNHTVYLSEHDKTTVSLVGSIRYDSSGNPIYETLVSLDAAGVWYLSKTQDALHYVENTDLYIDYRYKTAPAASVSNGSYHIPFYTEVQTSTIQTVASKHYNQQLTNLYQLYYTGYSGMDRFNIILEGIDANGICKVKITNK